MNNPPRKRQTLKELQELQRLAASVIMQPLAPGFRSSRTFTDGRANSVVASEFIKPNDRLTAFERIEIYNKQYWYRLIDCIYDDYPGLRALLGRLKFNRLMFAYLKSHPSRSYTMRNLGDRLEQFIADHPDFTAPRTQLCREMAAFEWAQVVAFDGPMKAPVQIDDLLEAKPDRLRLGVQPYISLLHLHWALDDFTLAIKRSSLRGEASNAVDAPSTKPEKRKAPRPKKIEIFLAIHRFNNDLYYKRLDQPAYLLLEQLRQGKTLAAAVESTIEECGGSTDWTANIQAWFANWSELGWFCKYSR
jgi:hypothetical protein